LREVRSFIIGFRSLSFWTLLVSIILLSFAVGVPLSEAKPPLKAAPRNGLEKDGRARHSFNGKYLRPETEYALVQYLGDVTGDRGDIWIVGLGLSNGNGDLHLSGEWQPWLGRFWVVLGEDVVGEADGATVLDRMASWNPAEYLFEYGEF
jgi:hypothetical protein